MSNFTKSHNKHFGLVRSHIKKPSSFIQFFVTCLVFFPFTKRTSLNAKPWLSFFEILYTLILLPTHSLPHTVNQPCHEEYHCDIYGHPRPTGLCRFSVIGQSLLEIHCLEKHNNHQWMSVWLVPFQVLAGLAFWSPSLSVNFSLRICKANIPRFSSITTRLPAKSNEMEMGCYALSNHSILLLLLLLLLSLLLIVRCTQVYKHLQTLSVHSKCHWDRNSPAGHHI